MISNNRSAPRVSRPALTWRERAEAYDVARFVNHRRNQGRHGDLVWTEVQHLWPAATPPVLDAAEFLDLALCDGVRFAGWPDE